MTDTVESVLRPELPELTSRIAKLPVRRGYPVPWFVAWVDGEPDFRVIGPGKPEQARAFGLCWICGGRLGSYVAFTIGPMCAVNRVSAEPPSHRDCADWSARACPFLTRPHAKRREDRLPDGHVEPAGIMLRRNPGVTLVWVTRAGAMRYRRNVGLYHVGDPEQCSWYAEGRPATRAEVLASIETGLPALQELATAEGPRAEAHLQQELERALQLLPTT